MTDSLSVKFSSIIQGDSRVIHVLAEEDLLGICDKKMFLSTWALILMVMVSLILINALLRTASME
jgi:hypothetical protein